jgi:PIN domain nuclease of toxin-antitoxin system
VSGTGDELLLDTHVVLWWLADDHRLGATARETIFSAPAAHVSAASTWEVAIKLAIGKLELDAPDGAAFPDLCEAQGFGLVGVDHRDAWAVHGLAPSRADPFDRLIAATARRRGFTVVSADQALAGLGVHVVPA